MKHTVVVVTVSFTGSLGMMEVMRHIDTMIRNAVKPFGGSIEDYQVFDSEGEEVEVP